MDLSRFFKPKTPDTPTQTSQKPSTVPMLNQALSATKGATNTFSAVGASLKKLGALNIQAGIGYGIGFSHGFGVGLSMRSASGVWNQIQSGLVVATTNMMMRFGVIPRLPFSQRALPAPPKSAQKQVTTDQISAGSIMQLASKSAEQISGGSMMQLATKSASQISQGPVESSPSKVDSAFENKASKGEAIDSTLVSQSVKVISNLPQDPSLKGEAGRLNEAAGRMQSESKILQTVLKQRQLIEELVEENEKLHQILEVKDLKTPPSKVQASSSGSQILGVKDLKTPSSKVQASSSDSNLQISSPSEVLDKSTGDSRPPGDADGTSPTPKGENDSKKEKSSKAN